MKFRRDAVTNSPEPGSRDEIRELAESLSLWRSAMHHAAARQLPRPHPVEAPRGFRLGLVLTPVLSAAVAAGVLVPLYSHLHRHPTASAASSAPVQQSGPARASLEDDTALMNQIDSELSQDVPDALRPLADLSAQATNPPSATETSHATQE